MAFTVTRYKQSVGAKRQVGMDITADAATQTIETGLKVIEWYTSGEASMNSSNIHMAINSNASGVQSNGVFSVTGCTSGDHFYVTCYGR
jgi:uncharacterized lipoprotein YddW (UPF0748 family)